MHLKLMVNELIENMSSARSKLAVIEKHLDSLDNPAIREIVVGNVRDALQSLNKASDIVSGEDPRSS